MREAAAAKLNAIPNVWQYYPARHLREGIWYEGTGIRESPFSSIQLDKSTDVTNCAQLMVYVRYTKELSVQEEFLFCHSLPARTTAEEILKALNDFIQESHIDGATVVKYAPMAQGQ